MKGPSRNLLTRHFETSRAITLHVNDRLCSRRSSIDRSYVNFLRCFSISDTDVPAFSISNRAFKKAGL